ncbi:MULTISPECIES: hypothetical protein [Sphingobacterium]|uniref:hypothetical protein n=1 Tax=Sphingobacterium TaxID=28453 RepID=UPI0028A5EC01|nr:hypothetical protein [Sphingobacterium multivorum]
MLNLINPNEIGKSVNLIYSYKKHLLKCIEEKLWIHHAQKWWSPYEFAIEYGRSWLMVFDENTRLINPYNILNIEADTTQKKHNTEAINELTTFKNKVDAYYREGWDNRLKISIETNRWV